MFTMITYKLSGYVDHSKNKSILKIHYNGCRNLVNNFKKFTKKVYSNWIKY